MSKRKPALRIGGVLNRGSLASNVQDNKESISHTAAEDVMPKNEMEAELADFMKEIDEVSSATVPNTETSVPERYGDWQKCIDEKTQHPYFWNVVTDEVSWVLPEVITEQDRPEPPSDTSPHLQTTTNSVQQIDNGQGSPVMRHTESPLVHDNGKEENLAINDVEEETTSVTKDQIIVNDTSSVGGDDNNDDLPDLKEEDESATKEASTQCNLCSSMCTAVLDDRSMKTEVLKLKDRLCGKMNFLGVSKASMINLQVLLLQVETRVADWKAKVLPTSYVLKLFQEADEQLKAFEENATPEGWSCHWDSNVGRYYYMNKITRHKQWNYPDYTAQEIDGDAEEDVPAKKCKTDPESGDDSPSLPPLPDEIIEKPPPPLPDAPIEVPPPPPPPPEDDGYDVDDDEGVEKDQDDGIMMEISDGEKEDANENKTSKILPMSVLSQQPVLYKGPETVMSSAPKTDISQPEYVSIPPVNLPQQIKDFSVKFKSKKTKTSKKSSSKKSQKAMTSLVAQWQRAKSEMDQEERMLEEEDEEERREEPTVAKIAKWKQDQILSGKALSNPNFEPVPSDWRTRLLAKKKAKLS